MQVLKSTRMRILFWGVAVQQIVSLLLDARFLQNLLFRLVCANCSGFRCEMILRSDWTNGEQVVSGSDKVMPAIENEEFEITISAMQKNSASGRIASMRTRVAGVLCCAIQLTTRIRNFGTRRSGKCSRTSAQALCPISPIRWIPCCSGVGIKDLPRAVR